MSSRKAVSTRISTGRPVGAPAGLTVVSFCPVYSASEPRSCAERVRGEVEASQDYGAGRGRDRRTSTPIPTASAVQQAAKELSKSGRQRHASNAALTVLVRRFLTSARWRRSTRLPNAPQNQRRQTWPRRPSRRAARIGAERSARGDPRRRGCAALVRAPSRANAGLRPQPRAVERPTARAWIPGENVTVELKPTLGHPGRFPNAAHTSGRGNSYVALPTAVPSTLICTLLMAALLSRAQPETATVPEITVPAAGVSIHTVGSPDGTVAPTL